MITVPTDIPQQLRVGDTWKWKKSLSDYPASADWFLTYVLINSANKITLVSVADGDDHLISKAASETIAYTKGEYKYHLFVEYNQVPPAQRYSHETGELEILPDAETELLLDTRTRAQTELDRIDGLITGNLQGAYSIGTPDGGSRSVTRHDIRVLEELRQYWQGVRNTEIRRDRLKRGLGHRGNIKVWLS